MANCPFCSNSVRTSPPSWSGGRMHVECGNCGKYEIAPMLFEELAELPEASSCLERLREGFANVPEPRVIRKHHTNIVHVEPKGADKPTKLRKRSLRAKAEGKSVRGGSVFYAGNGRNEGGT